jgi:hypothetical protein
MAYYPVSLVFVKGKVGTFPLQWQKAAGQETKS